MKYVALLRAINVGGHTVKMDELKRIFGEAGYQNVSTYIQSGNVLFESDEPEDKLIANVESALKKALGYEVPVILRSLKELQKAIKDNPFPDAVGIEHLHLYIGFMAQKPTQEILGANQFDNIIIKGREVYILMDKSKGQTIADKLPITKPLEKMMTVRNWNTVNKLIEKM